jgi:dipeptidyl aminopeptidase/acylaminoacyl peptidase
LLKYQDEAGRWQPVQSEADWRRRRQAILEAMQQVMGPLPSADRRAPLEVRVDEEIDFGAFVRRRITYQAEPGSRVPAFLLIPKRVFEDPLRKCPAVLCLHPTDDQNGHRVVVAMPDRSRVPYARELAELGFVTLAPAYPKLADYQPDWAGLGYASGTMKAVWDNLRGVDLLQSLPFVDGRSIGAIGHSLGGHNSVFTAAFDERIQGVVSNCGLDSFADYMQGDIRGWTSDRYMPRLLDYRDRLDQLPFDFPEVIAALAPRHCLIIAPRGDTNFGWQSAGRVADAARPVYRWMGVEPRLQVLHPDCDHEFPRAQRQQAYQWLAQVLREAAQPRPATDPD